MVYFNNAATGFPKPNSVIDAVNKQLSRVPIDSSRVGIELSKKDFILETRKKIANLFSIKDPNQVIFTSGATESLNLAILGLDLQNAHVITTCTEHNSVIRPLKYLEKKLSTEITFLNCDSSGFIDPADFQNSVKPNTKLFIVNHSSNVTGIIQDIKSIAKIAHENNSLILVDAAQTAGLIDIDLNNLDIDFLAFAGHKSMHGYPGIGCLIINNGIDLKPLKYGGTGIKSDLLYQPTEIPIYYEAGTPNYLGIVSLNAGIDFINEIGIHNIRTKVLENRIYIFQALEEIETIILYGNNAILQNTAAISFNLKNVSTDDVCYILENSFNIIVRAGLHCAPLIHDCIGSSKSGTLRISPSYFTTTEEINQLIQAIKKIEKAT